MKNWLRKNRTRMDFRLCRTADPDGYQQVIYTSVGCVEGPRSSLLHHGRSQLFKFR